MRDGHVVKSIIQCLIVTQTLTKLFSFCVYEMLWNICKLCSNSFHFLYSANILLRIDCSFILFGLCVCCMCVYVCVCVYRIKNVGIVFVVVCHPFNPRSIWINHLDFPFFLLVCHSCLNMYSNSFYWRPLPSPQLYFHHPQHHAHRRYEIVSKTHFCSTSLAIGLQLLTKPERISYWMLISTSLSRFLRRVWVCFFYS